MILQLELQGFQLLLKLRLGAVPLELICNVESRDYHQLKDVGPGAVPAKWRRILSDPRKVVPVRIWSKLAVHIRAHIWRSMELESTTPCSPF